MDICLGNSNEYLGPFPINIIQFLFPFDFNESMVLSYWDLLKFKAS
jgi:hypothetical protein